MRDTNPGAYRAIWRWHFYAGLMVAPFVLLLSLTGALYLFDREIEGIVYADRMHVPAVRAPLPLLDQQAAVLRAYPGVTVKRIVLPERPTDAGQWLVARDGVDTLVFVDPGSGRVTGDIDPEWRLMAVVRRIHGTLLAGQVGSYIVELMACWTLIMLGTGLILWWPRHWRLRGVFVPRLAARGRRFWRDLHAIPAMVNALLVMGLILTGLPWSAFWGVQFARIGTVSPLTEPSPNFRDPPEHAEHKLTTADGVPWTIANSPARTAAMATAGQRWRMSSGHSAITRWRLARASSCRSPAAV
ncbi:PepSY domain-containing protein [Hankyongella ginsenosidimutans]|uniref:PepSY domain-containing protein n=1 Tax=Hankyongella ginsenosidimutans TaxID=1763828 RepID=A0A4D7C6X9_9SPHN|nr:PepSY domain-containing protein [Hankyongella ginsenosidimutans]